MRACGGPLPFRKLLVFLDAGRGPAEPPREVLTPVGLGVPGPREDWRIGAAERWMWAGLRRRRLLVSMLGERVAFAGRFAAVAEEAALVEVGRPVLVRGEGWRGWTPRRVRGLALVEVLAMVVEGPTALPERGWRGVEAPVEVVVERGGRRVWREEFVRREGSWGSMEMEPSFWRSRILRSRRLIWRSSFWGVSIEIIDLQGGAYEQGGFFTESNFFVLDGSGFVKIGENGFGVDVFFWVCLAGAVGFEEFLNAVVAHVDGGTAFLDYSVFGVDLFHQVSYLGG